jgi:hypothetical protein
MDGDRAIQILKDLVSNWKATTAGPGAMVDPVKGALVLKGLELALGQLTTEVLKERVITQPEIIMNSLNGGPVKAAGYSEDKHWLRIEKSTGEFEDYYNMDPYYFYSLFRSADPYQFYVENIVQYKDKGGGSPLIL